MVKITIADVVRAIIDSKIAAPATDVVFDALDRSDSLCGRITRKAIDAGLVELWDDPEYGQLLTLTPYGAAQAGVELTSHERPSWKPIGEPEPAERSLHQHKSEVRFGLEYEGFEDFGSPDPLNLAILAEEYFAAIKRGEKAGETSPVPEPFSVNPDHPPRMRVLYGQRLQWPVEREAGERCPACFGFPLLLFGYCLVCDRSGIDRFLPGPEELKRRKRFERSKLKGGKGS